MKNLKHLAFAAIIGLVSATGFTSCKDGNDAKDEPQNENSQNYQGETVKTQFLINIAENVSRTSSRNFMPAATVQVDGTRAEFRGMDSIVLIPFNDATYAARLGRNIVLDPIAATAGTNAGQMNAQNSVYYTDVAIPLGTKYFLFYGKAIDNAANVALETVADKHQFGILESKNLRDNGGTRSNSNPADISFGLKSIYETAGTPAKATALATYLTSIAQASKTVSGTTYAWSSASTSNSGLKDLYDTFTSLRASSSFLVARTLTDLYNTLQRYQATQVEDDPAAAAVLEAIENNTYATVSGSAIPYTVTLTGDAAGYPANINLPDGAVALTFTSGAFSPAVAAMGDFTLNSLNQYTFPASLAYFGKSSVKTATESKQALYDGVNTWAQILAEYTQGVEVVSSTRSVAINDPINYGVGQFKVRVKHTASAIKDSHNEDYTVPAGGLVWSGVLVGGQKRVDYQFEQISSESNVFTIFDNHLNGNTSGEVKLESANYKDNYTLVLGTADNDAKNDEIYFALEMVNKGADFFGHDGLVPANGTYYLIGKLKIDANADQTNHPEHYNIFFKDYVTTANVTITSLANAYNVIPDLRSDGLELGFSVNLEWQPGLIFNVEL